MIEYTLEVICQGRLFFKLYLLSLQYLNFYLKARARGHSGFPLGLISVSNFQNGGLNERATVCGIGRLVAAA